MVIQMLDQLIQAALEECAQRRKFPPTQVAQSVSAWIKQKDRGRCENGSDK